MAAEVSPDLIREWYTKDLTLEQQQVFLDTVARGFLGDHQDIVDEIRTAIGDNFRQAYALARKTRDKVNVDFLGEPGKTKKLIQAFSENGDGEAFLKNLRAEMLEDITSSRKIVKEMANAAEGSKRPPPLWKQILIHRHMQLAGERIRQISEILADFDARRKQATEEAERRLEARRLAEMQKRVADASPPGDSPAWKRARTAAAALEVTQGDVAAAARLLLLF